LVIHQISFLPLSYGSPHCQVDKVTKSIRLFGFFFYRVDGRC
jgi:hypothetical protein